MGFLSRIVADAPRNVHDAGWWPGTSYVGATSTGISVNPDLAFQCSCIFQGVRLIAETVGALPLILYREQEDGGKTRARDHRLWNTLRKRPNAWQTAQEWRETMTAHAVGWGAGLSEITVRGQDLDLLPLQPETVETQQIEGSGRLRFIVREPGKPERVLLQDQVFRLQGLALHRFVPVNLLKLAREAIGLWLAMEKFGGLYFAQGAKPTLFLEHPGTLSDGAYQRLQNSAQAKYAGLNNMHKVVIGEEGLKPHPLSFNAHDSQMVEARQEQVLEIARWLNIPEHMFRAGKQPTYASVVQVAQEYVNYTVTPWTRRWEGSIDRDLLDEDDVFAEHLFEGLLRGNTVERFQAYASAIMNGWMSENEVRIRENLNPVDGLDEPRRSVNQDRGGDPRQSDAAASAHFASLKEDLLRALEAHGGPTAEGYADTLRNGLGLGAAEVRRLAMMAKGSVDRVVRREISAIEDKAGKLAGQPAAWREWVAKFYEAHATLVAETLQLELGLARAYCDEHARLLLAGGVLVLETWEAEAPGELLALVGCPPPSQLLPTVGGIAHV